MIHLITLNPAIDHFITCDDLAVGKTNYISDDYIIFGGKAINVAQVLKELKTECTLVTTTDHIYNQFIIDSIEGIKHHLIEVDNVRINTKVMINSQITELNSTGKSLGERGEEFIKYVRENVNADDYVLIAGNPNPNDYQLMIQLCQEVNKYTDKLIIDSSKVTIDDLKELSPYLIKPNDEELETLVARELSDEAAYLSGAHELINSGIKRVALSLGSQGSMYIEENQAIRIPVIKGDVVNTVGAGDSYVAGLLYGLVNDLELVEVLKYATACATATAFNKNLATRELIDKYYKQVKIEK